MNDEMKVSKSETLTSIKHDLIADATKRDDQLQMLKRVISDGWPTRRADAPLEILQFWDFRDELSTYNGVIYHGERIIIPAIHSSHMGILKCKQRARELVYWPGMNKQIEDVVSRGSACLQFQRKPQKEPMLIHPIPSLPCCKVPTDVLTGWILFLNHDLLLFQLH
jgi:hypothetical protein